LAKTPIVLHQLDLYVILTTDAKLGIVLTQIPIQSEDVKATREGHAVLSAANALMTFVPMVSLAIFTMDFALFQTVRHAPRVSNAISIATCSIYNLREFVLPTILVISITTEL